MSTTKKIFLWLPRILGLLMALFLYLLATGTINLSGEGIRGSKWYYLPGTKEETEKIKLLFDKKNIPVILYTGEKAIEDAFKNECSKKSPSLILIATHGFFFPEPEKDYEKLSKSLQTGMDKFTHFENPLLRSGLIFAGANRVWMGGKEIKGVEDGILTAQEVSNLDLTNTELVVLSACETGLGDIKSGEGVYGLQRAFKSAGAKAIIMTLWKVLDEETVELIERFYSNLIEKNMTNYEALSEAQQFMRNKYPDEPYKWAAFVLME